MRTPPLRLVALALAALWLLLAPNTQAATLHNLRRGQTSSTSSPSNSAGPGTPPQVHLPPPYLVPVMEPETAPYTFNALNPTPNLPAVMPPNPKSVGDRPFLAMAGIGVGPGLPTGGEQQQ